MKMKSIFSDMDLACKLIQVETYEDLDALGFKMYKPMDEVLEYKGKTPYKAWLAYKYFSDNEIYIIAVSTNGNGYLSFLFNDVPVEELLNDCFKTCLNCKHKCVADTDEIICSYSEEKVAEDYVCEDFEKK